MKKIYDERVQSKKLMILAKQEYQKTPTKELEKSISKYNNIQMARKIQLNSAYGAIGNQYFRYYNIINAEAITLSGQVSIRWIEHKMNAYLNKILKTEKQDYVIASDTDSIYLIWVLWSRLYTRGERQMIRASSLSLIRCVRWYLKNIYLVLIKRWPHM